jgi:hypothetical protein
MLKAGASTINDKIKQVLCLDNEIYKEALDQEVFLVKKKDESPLKAEVIVNES